MMNPASRPSDPSAQRYECPICFTVARWTDGTVKASGDERDEFWCQACGVETPLEDCRPVECRMSKGISAAVDALRDLHPNTRITVRLGSQRYGVTVDARTIVKDYDDAAADRDYWKAEAQKWQGIADRLSDVIAAKGECVDA